MKRTISFLLVFVMILLSSAPAYATVSETDIELSQMANAITRIQKHNTCATYMEYDAQWYPGIYDIDYNAEED